MCSVLQENLRICATCHLLKATAFQRPRLMRLRVKDLRQYLLLRNIPTDTCREKEDLVDLVLCHQGIEEEEEGDAGSLHSRSLYTQTPSTTQSASELSAFAASQEEEALSRSDSSDTNQVRSCSAQNHHTSARVGRIDKDSFVNKQTKNLNFTLLEHCLSRNRMKSKVASIIE